MSSEVTIWVHDGAVDFEVTAKFFMHALIEDKKLFGAGAPERIDDHADAVACVFRGVGEDAFDHQISDFMCGAQVAHLDARLAVNAQTQLHLALLYGEKRFVLTGQGAAREGDAVGADSFVHLIADAF